MRLGGTRERLGPAARRGRSKKDVPIPAYLRPRRVSKADMHQLLRDMLASREPKVQKLLRTLWAEQAGELTESTVLAAISAGKVPDSVYSQLRAQWEKFTTDQLLPLTTDGAVALGDGWARGAGLDWQLTPGLEDVLRVRADRLAVELSAEQQRALQLLVRFHSEVEPIPAGQLAARIRGFVGLTGREAQAVLNFSQRAEEAGTTGRTLERLVANYESGLRQARALRIARTELAEAAGAAVRDALDAARAEGLLRGEVVREWSTAEDEAVCPICGDLDGERVSLDGSYAGGIARPPAHPSCRCVELIFELVPKG